MDEGNVIKLSVSVFQLDLDILTEQAESLGVGISQANRSILREWKRMKRDGVVLPHPADAQPVPVMYVTDTSSTK